MKVTRIRFAANEQMEVKRVIGLEVHLGQRVPETSFLIVTNLRTEMILETAYLNKNVEELASKNAHNTLQV